MPTFSSRNTHHIFKRPLVASGKLRLRKRFIGSAAKSLTIKSEGESPGYVQIPWRPSDDVPQHSELNSRYLRDCCPCSKCRHPETNQRLLNTFDLPDKISIRDAAAEDLGLRITWSDQGGHESVYSWEWLVARAKDSDRKPDTNPSDLTLWTSDIAEKPPIAKYGDVMQSREGLRDWVNKIKRWGFCYVDGCPTTPEATKELLERIAFIRETHYGGFWDFTSDLSSKDTAYTSIELGPHTDTTYFTDPAGLQMFHLLSHTDGGGGQSLLVDGFHAAQELHREDPAAFNTLVNVQFRAHATGNDDAKIITPIPLSVLKYHGYEDAGRLSGMIQVRWNNDDRGSFCTTDNEEIAGWYRAAKKWQQLISKSQHQYWAQLRPGRPVIFDNWRVLHGRKSFTGKRRLCGGYINMDDYLSKWRTLNFSSKEISNMI